MCFLPLPMGSRFLTFHACTFLGVLKLSSRAWDGDSRTRLEVVASMARA